MIINIVIIVIDIIIIDQCHRNQNCNHYWFFYGELVAGEVRQLPDKAPEYLHRTGDDDHDHDGGGGGGDDDHYDGVDDHDHDHDHGGDNCDCDAVMVIMMVIIMAIIIFGDYVSINDNDGSMMTTIMTMMMRTLMVMMMTLRWFV